MGNQILCDAFLDYISDIERSLFKDAIETSASEFSPVVQEKLLQTLARFDCRQRPNPSDIKSCLRQVAQFEFSSKPAAALTLMHTGITNCHTRFWSCKSVEGVGII